MSTPLEDYAVIGDCETAALVSRQGSIDWLCWPRFDSGACFAALLGTSDHGRWLLDSADSAVRRSRSYRTDTLILETAIETTTGAVTVIDFMPPRGKNSDVVRLVRGERGSVRMRTELVRRSCRSDGAVRPYTWGVASSGAGRHRPQVFAGVHGNLLEDLVGSKPLPG